MMFIDRNDGLRTRLNTGSRDAESMIRRNHPVFGISMPAFGEAICKVHEKGEASNALFLEMNRLMKISFIEPRYISDPDDAYRLARLLCSKKTDGRDSISPMDGLILATAIADPECSIFYTSDHKLLFNEDVKDIVSDFRSEIGAEPLYIRFINDALPHPLRCF